MAARIILFFGFPDEIRRAIYTTNTIESLNYSIRRITKNRSLFPNEDALAKLLYVALKNASKKWTIRNPNWPVAMGQFSIIFEGRVPLEMP